MKKLLIALSLSACAGVAFASTAATTANQNDHQGFYLGAMAGYNRTNYKDADEYLYNRQPNGGTVGLDFGYQFNRYFALEAGGFIYSNLTIGTFNYGSLPIDVDTNGEYSLYFAAKGILPVTQNFNIFGKLGVAVTQADLTDDIDDISAPIKEETAAQAAPLVGLGVSYYMTQHLSASLEGIYISDNGGETIPSHVIGVAGLAYHF